MEYELFTFGCILLGVLLAAWAIALVLDHCRRQRTLDTIFEEKRRRGD